MTLQSSLPVEQRTRCVHTTNQGTRCTRLARAGEDACRQHAGRAQPRTPTAISPDEQEEFFEALKLGLSIDRAAVIAGIPRSTVFDWMRRAQEPQASPVYRDFLAGVELARVDWEKRSLEQMAEMAKTDFRALRWMLETLAPERYGRNAAGRSDGQLDLGDLGGAKDNPREKDNVVPIRGPREAPDW